MPRNMSFAMTTQQVLSQTKSVTRRFGWWYLKPGDIIQPVKQAMGLKLGEKIIRLNGPIEILSAWGEPLNAITQDDVMKEGFPDWTPNQFIEFLVSKYKCDPTKEINRIEYKYLEPVACQRSLDFL